MKHRFAVITVSLFVAGVFSIASPFLWDGGVCFFLSPPTDIKSDAALANFGESWASVLFGVVLVMTSLFVLFARFFFQLGKTSGQMSSDSK